MKFESGDFIESRLRLLMKDSRYQEFNYSFEFLNTIETDAILFIGFNPSVGKNEDISQTYLRRELKEKTKMYPYFNKMEEISIHCDNVPWTHLDLLYYKKNEQETIYEILKKDFGVDYIKGQLDITRELIFEKALPKVIIVSNALAGKILGKESTKVNSREMKLKKVCFNYPFKFDSNLGTDKWENIPVFFCSMLSGGRALDNGSYERLKWHIKKSLNQL